MDTGFTLTYRHRDGIHRDITDTLITHQTVDPKGWDILLTKAICTPKTSHAIHGFNSLTSEQVEAMLFLAQWKEVTTEVAAAVQGHRYFLTKDYIGMKDRITLTPDIAEALATALPVILDVKRHVLTIGISKGMMVHRATAIVLASHCDVSYRMSKTLYMDLTDTRLHSLCWYDPTVSIYHDTASGDLLTQAGVISIQEAYQLGITTVTLVDR